MILAVIPWLERPLQITAVVIGVGVLVFFHELGHFLAAKWQGVRVERFALGLWAAPADRDRGDGQPQKGIALMAA